MTPETFCSAHMKMAEDVAVTRTVAEDIKDTLNNGLMDRMRKIETRTAVTAWTLRGVVAVGAFLLVFGWHALWQWIRTGA